MLKAILRGILIDLAGEIATVVFVLLLVFVISRGIKIKEEEKNNIIELTIYSFPTIFMIYPILNSFHIILANVFVFITTIYAAQLILTKIELKEKFKQALYLIELIAIIIITGYSVLNIYRDFVYLKLFNKNQNVYYGGIFLEGQEENIKKVCDYIELKAKKGIKVIFISHKAMLYTAPLNINNGKLDLPFMGNLGKDGEAGLVKEISEFKNTEILISKDEEDMVQESKMAIEYVKNNYELVGEIEDFYIYKTGEQND